MKKVRRSTHSDTRQRTKLDNEVSELEIVLRQMFPDEVRFVLTAWEAGSDEVSAAFSQVADENEKEIDPFEFPVKLRSIAAEYERHMITDAENQDEPTRTAKEMVLRGISRKWFACCVPCILAPWSFAAISKIF